MQDGDADEDVVHLSGANQEQVDLSDETQDFRFLANLSLGENGTSSLPKRGEKDFEPHSTNKQASALEASRDAMHAAISHTRIHNPKNHILATYDATTNMACVENVKGQIFRTMGRHVQGKMWLLPEEALYLLERGSLDVRWPAEEDEDEGVPMSLQGAYAAFIGMENGVGGSLTLERYTVYAGLKRSGYIVQRADSWTGHTGTLEEESMPSADQTRGAFWKLGVFSELWRRIVHTEPKHPIHRYSTGPLVTPGLYRSYEDVYRLLNLIPAYDPRTPPKLSDSFSTSPYHVAYFVYKPSPTWKKTAPGSPDFRICVVNARETTVPTLDQLNDLLASTPYNPPKKDVHIYQKVKHGYRNVILAVVDQGIASYMRIADAAFGMEEVFVRPPPRGGGGKRGGRRGGKRGGKR
ncbi:tRNA splicing endonuclease-like protein subunit [Saccharata proteae CBS 121410]|uniref:tRNA splicing endonuclease-like protein subunit n=1 Tax=Saccharata proteae CBS 121410 TaxID=1314787 RepID=A0A6A5YDC9_9PEZI|nr:tRNA splicing endonuclease-like protein subunit [Saccharata proteae CBS 121410]